MLSAPPPGYSPFAMNRQTVNPLGSPGVQSLAVQGHSLQSAPASGLSPALPTPGASSFTMPSSQVPQQPSQNPWGVLGPHNVNNIVRALGGASP